MTNVEIMKKYKEENGINENVQLLSFQEWRKQGYSVRKGETSHHKVDLWKLVKAKAEVKTESVDATEENKEVKKVPKYIKKKTALFEFGQVEPLKAK